MPMLLIVLYAIVSSSHSSRFSMDAISSVASHKRIFAAQRCNASGYGGKGVGYGGKGVGYGGKGHAEAPATDNSQCAALVKQTLLGLTTTTDINDRIGAVLGTNDGHAAKCCQQGTEYDAFVLSSVQTATQASLKIDKKTAIFVIDVQRDFTDGSFGQPCWGTGGTDFIKGLTTLIDDSVKKGAVIIASKDYHPSDHCSFGVQSEKCNNLKDYTDEAKKPGKRYVNNFPGHCVYTKEPGSAYAKPQAAPDTAFCKSISKHFRSGFPSGHYCGDATYYGAALHPALATALGNAPKEQVEIIYKGFNPTFDSFSGTPHLAGSMKPKQEEQIFTGGYALPAERSATCHGKWDSPQCQPLKTELAEPNKTMRSVLNILNWKSIEKAIVVGLVFDYCVKETALFAMEAAAETVAGRPGWFVGSLLPRLPEVTVLADLSRPSFDGKPGAPFTGTACGQDATDNLCKSGGGTTPLYQKLKKEFEAGGVKLVRQTCNAQ